MANGTLAASQIEMLSQSGTGIITITPPSTNTNRAITLPDAAGAIVVSGTTPSLNGITFPATQVASANANTLDDYEEGTATASLICGSGTAAVVSGYETLSYTKIGRLVSVTGRIAVGTVSAASGSLKLNGLPFTVGNALSFQGGCAMFVYGMAGMTGIIIGTVIANTTTIEIYRTSNAGTLQNDVSAYLSTNNSEFWVSFTYMTT